MMTENAIPAAEQEVVAICRDLIRIDTTSPGDHSGPGERKAAEYVAGLLSEVGVVPANASDWRQDPFGGEIADGCIWGRGAVDMKDMDAIMLAVVRQRLREN